MTSYEQAKTAHDAHSKILMSREDCVGCGLGKSDDDKDWVIIICALNGGSQFPSTLSVGDLTVQTKVIVTGMAVAGPAMIEAQPGAI